MKGCRLAVYQLKSLPDNYTSEITHKNPFSHRERVFELSIGKVKIQSATSEFFIESYT